MIWVDTLIIEKQMEKTKSHVYFTCIVYGNCFYTVMLFIVQRLHVHELIIGVPEVFSSLQ